MDPEELNKLRLLLVDDEADFRRALGSMMKPISEERWASACRKGGFVHIRLEMARRASLCWLTTAWMSSCWM
jgi:hypothetical protein